MAWPARSPRRARLPTNWNQIRAQRLELDNYQCTKVEHGQRCTAQATDVDHIDSMTDDNRIDALRSLCGPHHRSKSAREGGTASAQRRSTKRQPPKHPSQST